MSYIQIEIGGRKRGLKFNQFAHTEYLTISAGYENPVMHSYALIYAGLLGNCVAEREQPDFKFKDVCDWVDQVTDSNVFTDILKVYKETLPKVEVKKKTVKKKSAQPSTKSKALK